MDKEHATISCFVPELYYQSLVAWQAGKEIQILGFIERFEDFPEMVTNQTLTGFERHRLAMELFLIRCAAISRILYSAANPTRAKILRDHLDISDTGPLAARGVRNSFEHTDERIDHAVAYLARQAEHNEKLLQGVWTSDDDGFYGMSWFDRDIEAAQVRDMAGEVLRLKKAIEQRHPQLRRP